MKRNWREVLEQISPETYKEELGFSNSQVLQAMREAYNLSLSHLSDKLQADAVDLYKAVIDGELYDYIDEITESLKLKLKP